MTTIRHQIIIIGFKNKVGYLIITSFARIVALVFKFFQIMIIPCQNQYYWPICNTHTHTYPFEAMASDLVGAEECVLEQNHL